MGTQEETKKLVRKLVEKTDCSVVELTVTNPEYVPKDKAIVITWRNADGMILRFQISDNESIPNEVSFFYNDGARLPHFRSIVFNNHRDVLPSELKEYVNSIGDDIYLEGSRSTIKGIIIEAISDASSWDIID